MFTPVEEANPEIVLAGLFAGITCFMSIPTTELAGIETAGTTTIVSRAIVAVAVDVVVLANTMFVTTAVVLVLGAVYSVVDDVAAAVLAKAFVTVGIVYSLS